MKYELEPEEMKTIHETLMSMTNVFCGTLIEIHKMKHEIELLRLKNSMGYNYESETPEAFVDEDPLDFPVKKMSVVRGGQPFVRFPEPDLTEHQQNGKKVLLDLIKMWLQGFRIEGAEQPDRGGYMETLGKDPKVAGSLVSYVMVLGSLTKAVYIVAHENSEELATLIDEQLTDEYIRYLAANIMQVASVYLQPLADLFIYPNPLS